VDEKGYDWREWWYNLYGMVGNKPVNKWDYLGLMSGSFGPHPAGKVVSHYAGKFGDFGKALASAPAHSCKCKCNKEASKTAGYDIYEISCSLTLTYQISMATDKSPIWEENLTSYKTFPTPKNWSTMSLKQKKAHVWKHELKHIANYKAWYDKRKTVIESAEAAYYTKKLCDDKKKEIKKDNNSTFKTTDANENAHTGW
jgi:hypothetical protein